jgi:hypothetical protein
LEKVEMSGEEKRSAPASHLSVTTRVSQAHLGEHSALLDGDVSEKRVELLIIAAGRARGAKAQRSSSREKRSRKLTGWRAASA